MMSENEVREYERQLLVALSSLERQIIETKAKLIVIAVITEGGK